VIGRFRSPFSGRSPEARRRDGFSTTGTRFLGDELSGPVGKACFAVRFSGQARLIRIVGSVVRPVISSTLWGGDRNPPGRGPFLELSWVVPDSFVKGLILAQNERWRRGLGMQVERAWFSDQVSGARVSKATATNPMVGHSRGKLRVIPSEVRVGHPT
jgi:hypothetical protein